MRRFFMPCAVVVLVLGSFATAAQNLGLANAFKCLFAVLFGWFWFLVDVIPRMTVDVPSAVLGPIALVFFLLGFHYFLRGLSARGSSEGDHSKQTWRWRSSGRVVSLILIAFVAGTAMVGTIHEVLWLSTSKEPWIIHEAKQVWKGKEILPDTNLADR